MFKLATTPSFTHVVKVSVPVDGGFEEQTFRARFNVLPANREAEHDLMTVEGSNAFLVAIVAELLDVVGEDDAPLTYNDGLRDRLFSLPFIRAALVRTYFAAIGVATEGN